MISETENYHGRVFSTIVRREPSVVIEQYSSNSSSSYIVNGVGLYIKYSTKRMSPWTFTFLTRHQNEIKKMKEELGDVTIALVCGDDGIASLTFDELKAVLDDTHEEVERVGVSRPPRGKYRIVGSDGKLNKSIGINEFPGKIFNR